MIHKHTNIAVSGTELLALFTGIFSLFEFGLEAQVCYDEILWYVTLRQS